MTDVDDIGETFATLDELDILVSLLSKKLKMHIHRGIYELAVEQRDPSTTQMSLTTIDPRVLDSFLRWWHARPTSMHFSIRHIINADDAVYKSVMCHYLSGHDCRWLAFFMARTGINIDHSSDYTNTNSEHLMNFFHDQNCLDRDVLAMTFKPKYAKSLRDIQYEASERCVFIKLDVAMLVLWLYGSKEFHRQYDLQSNLSINPEDVPSFNDQKLYIIDWE